MNKYQSFERERVLYITLLEMFIIVTLEKAKKNLVGGVSYQEDIKLPIRLNCRKVKIDASQEIQVSQTFKHS